MARQGISIELDPKTLKGLKAGLKAVGDVEAAPFREAMTDSGRHLTHAVESRAPGSMGSKTEFQGLNKGAGANVRALGAVKHPAAVAHEFGRTKWPYGYTQHGKGSAQGAKTRTHKPGQVARPFVGLKAGNAAIGESRPYVEKRLLEGIAETWTSLGETS